MKMFKNITFLSIVLAVSVISCRKEENLGDVNDIPGLGGDTTTNTVIDQWIKDSMIIPYNIDVKYRWNQFTTTLISSNVVPPSEDVVIPVMSAVKRIWLQPYIEETNLIFFNQIAPKFFVLSGSSAAGPDGAVVGVAGGGRQINLLQINYYRNKNTPGYVEEDTTLQKNIFLTVHHEFSHIFDQLRRRTNDFDKISQSDYSADWFNTTDPAARQKGFVSAYASSVSTEDFAEMISFMLVYGKTGWDEFISKIVTYEEDPVTGDLVAVPNTEAQKKLRDKEAAVVSYFNKLWSIDFYSLQARVRAAVEKEFY